MNSLNIIFDYVEIEDDDNTISALPAKLAGNPLFDQVGQLDRRGLVVATTTIPLGFLAVGKKIKVILNHSNVQYVGQGNIVEAANDAVIMHLKLQ